MRLSVKNAERGQRIAVCSAMIAVAVIATAAASSTVIAADALNAIAANAADSI